jgi:hypothetical protein
MSEELKGGIKRRPNITPAQAGSSMRPEMRDEADDARSAAAQRAAELRGHMANRAPADDEFAVKHLQPDGWTYQWHTWSIYEQRAVTNMMQSEDRGWQPVPRSRHPEMMPRDSDSEVIVRKGQILMELPTEIVEEYRQAEAKAARDQIRWKEQQIAGAPDGTLPRDHAQTRPRISKGYEPMPIPKD